jgi:DUF4097 and DUF4098 domain-containing protein YvlB
MRRLLQTLLAMGLGASLVVLTGCAAAISGVTAKQVVESKHAVGKAPKIVVEMFNGGIDVFASAEEGQVRAKVTKEGRGPTEEEAELALEKIDVQTKQDGDTLFILARRLEPNVQGGASAVIEVPPGAVLDLRSSNGGVNVTGLTGGVVTATSNAGVKVKGSKGPLNLTTSNGAITVEGGSGVLDLTTSNGGITVEAKSAAVKAKTSNGRIQFKGGLAHGEQTFQTSNGGVKLVLPSEQAFKLEATTSNGRIHSDFPIQGGDKKRKNHLSAVVGENPDVTLKVTTSNGGIEIKKGI